LSRLLSNGEVTVFQLLETRRLLAIGGQGETPYFPTYEVFGTAKDDRIAIVIDSRLNETADGYRIVVNDVASQRFVLFDRLIIHANGGDDVIDINYLLPFDPTAMTTLPPIPTTIYGGGGNDHITAGRAAERIFAGDGNDTVLGHDGRDTIYGEGGDDLLRGGGGSDLVSGGDGFDSLRGDAGNDNLAGNASKDRLNGSTGNDTLEGGGGNDIAAGEDGDDDHYGGPGHDLLAGGAGDDYCEGEAGNDSLFGDAGADQVFGGTGEDAISGGTGDDQFQVADFGGGDPEYDLRRELIDRPPAPQNLVLSPSDTGGVPRLTWDYAGEASLGFGMQISGDGGVTWQPATGLSQGSLRDIAVFNLVDGGTNVVRLQARDDEAESDWGVSNALAIPHAGAISLIPQPLFGGTGFSLTWYDNSQSETGFEIYMRKGTTGDFSKIATLDPHPSTGEMTRAVRDLRPNTLYAFFIRTLHNGGVMVDSGAVAKKTWQAA
jgi:hypothetical protein